MASPELGRLLSLFPFCWRVFSARLKDASTSESGPRQPWGLKEGVLRPHVSGTRGTAAKGSPPCSQTPGGRYKGLA